MMKPSQWLSIGMAAVCFATASVADETNAPATNIAATVSAPEPAPPVANALATDVEALIRILQAKYVNPAQVADAEMSKAALQGIVTALTPGAELIPTNAPPAAATNQPPPVRSESVASLIGYVRLHALDGDALKELDKALAKLDAEKIDSLVIDLRFTKGGTFADATELVGRFVLKDKKLFAIESPQASLAATYTTAQSSAYIDWKLAVLVNAETAGPAEAAAAVLREQARALVVGVKSAGKAVLWSEEMLPSGQKIRIAIGKAVTANGTDLFVKGLVPDIPVEVKPETEQKIVFELSVGKKMREFVEEPEKEKRLNEAALVKMLGKGDTNGPSETVESEKPDEKGKKAPPPIDVALQRAVDILKGIRILHLD